MTTRTAKPYNLEDRAFLFAKETCLFLKKLSKTTFNIEYTRQLIRSSGSIGANYIEANESLGKKDFSMHIKIARKEAKETCYWLRLIIETNSEEFFNEGETLLKEARELKSILSSMLK